jgi:hypothetical protein
MAARGERWKAVGWDESHQGKRIYVTIIPDLPPGIDE